MKDAVFSDKQAHVQDFAFDQKVASVFDDMVDRSVPMYADFQRMITEMVGDYATPGSSIYDLGCATGTTMLSLDKVVDPTSKLIGVDLSTEMLDQCRMPLEQGARRVPYELGCADLNGSMQIKNASVVLMVLTLQFVRPLQREILMQSIFRGMNDRGCLILVEKVLGEHSDFNRYFIKHYYDMKRRNGYSDLEIAQKREALENVLVPYTLTENWEMLRRAGYRSWDVFFKWYNFCGIIAVK